MKKFLFVCSKDSILDIPWGLVKLKHPVVIFEKAVFDPLLSLEDQNIILQKTLVTEEFDYVISYLFIPAVSDICFQLSLPYISWTYDSPLVSLFKPEIFHPTNYTFIFDKAECRRLTKLGAPNIFHLPLAVNTERVGSLDITPEDEIAYSHDISFVGGLYEENTYNLIISQLPEKFQLELKLYLMKNMCIWNNSRPWPVLSDDNTMFMEKNFDAGTWNSTALLENSSYLGLLLLSKKLGEMERITVLNSLGENFSVHLYTKSHSPHLQNVNLHTGVDYYTDMNKIFYLSKINLNITLPSIETGIPQRVFDIMGCGGFVLTNYQEEIEDLFVIGKEIEVFRTVDELLEKCSYYLNHEKERLEIAINGYKKVRDHFSYPNQLQKILSFVPEG